MTDQRLKRLFEKPWIWAYLGALMVWIATIVFTQGQGAEDILITALSFATFSVIVGIGQMFVITLGPGNIDLSVPATINFAGAVSMKIMDTQDSMIAAGLFIALACGVAVGIFNYGLIRILRIPPIIATLSSSFLVQSAAIAYGRGIRIKPPPSLADFTTARIADIPVLAICFIVFAVLMSVVLHRTVYGRSVIAYGQNPRAARLAGISVEFTRFATYVLVAVLAALCGYLLSGFSGARPSTWDRIPDGLDRRGGDRRHLGGRRVRQPAGPVGRGHVHVPAGDHAQHLRSQRRDSPDPYRSNHRRRHHARGGAARRGLMETGSMQRSSLTG